MKQPLELIEYPDSGTIARKRCNSMPILHKADISWGLKAYAFDMLSSGD
jgi:hypothetical protein